MHPLEKDAPLQTIQVDGPMFSNGVHFKAAVPPEQFQPGKLGSLEIWKQQTLGESALTKIVWP